MMDEEVTWQP